LALDRHKYVMLVSVTLKALHRPRTEYYVI